MFGVQATGGIYDDVFDFARARAKSNTSS